MGWEGAVCTACELAECWMERKKGYDFQSQQEEQSWSWPA